MSSPFQKMFCKRSPMNSGFEIWNKERKARRQDRVRDRRISKGKLSVDPGMPHLGMQKTPRGGW